MLRTCRWPWERSFFPKFRFSSLGNGKLLFVKFNSLATSNRSIVLFPTLNIPGRLTRDNQRIASCKESKTVTSWIMDFTSWIPNSLSCFPDSKARDSKSKTFPGFRNDFLRWGERSSKQGERVSTLVPTLSIPCFATRYLLSCCNDHLQPWK